MLLFYVRHGEPIYDPDSLTPMGSRQAEAIGKRLALYGIDRIFASTSHRAVQTATPTAEMTGKQIVKLDFCNEAHAWRDLTLPTENGGRTWAFYHPWAREQFACAEIACNPKWYEDGRFADTRFKEGIMRVDREVDDWLLSLGYGHDRARGRYEAVAPTEERIALFAHQGFGLAFLSSLLDIPYPTFCTRFDMGHSDLTVIEFTEKEGKVIPKVLTLSNDGHLYREGLTTKYNNGVVF